LQVALLANDPILAETWVRYCFSTQRKT